MKNNISMTVIIAIICTVVTVLTIVCIRNIKYKKAENRKIENQTETTKKNINRKKDAMVNDDTSINVVPTMLDTITKDSCWCGTFQLVWNDMKNTIVKQDIKFSPQVKMAKNLNKESFKENMISSDYYYKKYGIKTLELKKEIERGIKEKFNQESEILDDFDWEENTNDIISYFFYTMLYRKFEYLNKFDKLDNGMFGKCNNVKYFGITNETSPLVDSQMKVLYYKAKSDFAIIVNTKSGDEVIFHKNPKGNTFKEIYDNMINLSDEYVGRTDFAARDTFKAPYLEFKEKKEYTDIEGKKFFTKNNNVVRINKAIQFVQLSIDDKGGEIKSDSGLDAVLMALPEEENIRTFEVDNTFALFLREKGKDMPYFAAIIDDISKYQ